MTVTNKPVTGESTKYAVKPLRGEGRSVSAEPVCSCAHLFVHQCTRDRGCSAHPVFPASSLEDRERPHFLGEGDLQTSGAVRRENMDLHLLGPSPPSSGRAENFAGRSRCVRSADRKRYSARVQFSSNANARQATVKSTCRRFLITLTPPHRADGEKSKNQNRGSGPDTEKPEDRRVTSAVARSTDASRASRDERPKQRR
jgi:hypothetical protein